MRPQTAEHLHFSSANLIISGNDRRVASEYSVHFLQKKVENMEKRVYIKMICIRIKTQKYME